MKDGLKDGKGIFYYNKDDKHGRSKYEGDFKNDKEEGKDIIIMAIDIKMILKIGLIGEKEYIIIIVVMNMKVILKTVKKKEKEYFIGMMVIDMKVIGKMKSNPS